jgi:hypothetical protein
VKRIHIIGSGPRTGTTLLAEAMVACFRIDHACEHEAHICAPEPLHGNCMLTKMPDKIGEIGLPLRLNRDLYVVCVVRDPRDTIVSFHGSNTTTYWAGLRYWKRFVKMHPRLASHERFITIRYEDLTTRPDAVQQYLMQRLPFLEKRHDFSRFQEVAQPGNYSLAALKGLRPIRPDGIGRWKMHLPRIKQQLAIHGSISAELVRFGYEPDASWETCLEGIEAERFDSVRPEFFSRKYFRRERRQVRREVFNVLLRSIGLGRLVAARASRSVGPRRLRDPSQT